MPTATHVVEKLIEDRPFLHEALRQGIVNNAALAEQLQPEIAKQLNKDVTFSAVNMAIRRLAEKLKKHKIERILFDSTSDITTRSHLVEVTVYKTGEFQSYIEQLHDLVDLKHGDFLTITQGLHEFMIITNEKHLKNVQQLFPKELIKKIVPKLSSVTVHISEQSMSTVGLFYIVTRALSWENINIVDIVSTYTELTFIIDEHNTGKAIDILSRLIEKNS